jgi:hypothetical protein
MLKNFSVAMTLLQNGKRVFALPCIFPKKKALLNIATLSLGWIVVLNGTAHLKNVKHWSQYEHILLLRDIW